MNEGARLANDEMFKKELLAKLDRIIMLLKKQQAVEQSAQADGPACPNCGQVSMSSSTCTNCGMLDTPRP